jgi:cell wall-associated NlpC family hydrolase
MPAPLRALRLLALPVLLATVLVATTWIVSTPAADAAARRSDKIQHATRIAANQKGDPYVYGAEGPNSFDCSGLTYYAYKKVGITLPRSSDDQYRRLRHIAKHRMKRGDLMFFHSGGSVYHVGIFVGWNDHRRVLLHAPNSGERVHRERVWTRSWYAGTLRPRHH